MPYETIYGGVGVTVAAAMLIGAYLLLPKGERSQVKIPFVLLILHGATVVVWHLLEPDSEALKPVRIAAILLLLLSVGRSAFLLLLHSIIVKRFAGQVPRIIRDLVQGLIFLGVVLITLRAAGVEPGSLLTTSALLTAVIGLSLQDTLGNLFSGLAIQAQQPFEVGDWIQFDEDDRRIGKVVEMNWRAVKVVTLEDVEITVPNNTLAKAALRNFSKPLKVVRRQTDVVAPYDVPPHRVQRLLVDAIRDIGGVLRRPAPSVVTTGFSDRGITYSVRWYIDDFDKREVIAGDVRDLLWYALHRQGIDIPVPLRSVHLHEMSEDRLQRQRQRRVRQRDEMLRMVDFLRALPEEPRHRLAEHADLRLYAAGEAILHEGERGAELFIIEYGEVQVTVRRSRRDVEVARLGEGQFFGEMSLMTGEERRATVRAVRDTEVLVISKKALQPILDSSPELAETISEVLARRQQELGEQIDLAHAKHVTDHGVEGGAVLLDRIKQFFKIGGDGS